MKIGNLLLLIRLFKYTSIIFFCLIKNLNNIDIDKKILNNSYLIVDVKILL